LLFVFLFQSIIFFVFFAIILPLLIIFFFLVDNYLDYIVVFGGCSCRFRVAIVSFGSVDKVVGFIVDSRVEHFDVKIIHLCLAVDFLKSWFDLVLFTVFYLEFYRLVYVFDRILGF